MTTAYNQGFLFEMPAPTLPTSYIGKMANGLLASDGVIIDTETTGLTNLDEVIQVAVIDMTGRVILESFVKPTKADIHPSAYEVHRIRSQQLIDAPTIHELNLAQVLNERWIVGYNVGFDRKQMMQSAWAIGDDFLYKFLNAPTWINVSQRPSSGQACWIDMMIPYAQHWAEPTKRSGEYRKQKLTDACAQQGIDVAWKHQALDDARATLALIRALAECQERRYKCQ